MKSADSNSLIGQAYCWSKLDNNTRKGLLDKYHSAGIKVILSVISGYEYPGPTTAGQDPEQLASAFVDFVKNYDLDGVDVNYQDIEAMLRKDGSAEKWLVTFTQALRAELPQGKYILTHTRESALQFLNLSTL